MRLYRLETRARVRSKTQQGMGWACISSTSFVDHERAHTQSVLLDEAVELSLATPSRVCGRNSEHSREISSQNAVKVNSYCT
eukprot:3097920-Amphidinium_carterae.1